MFTTTKDSYLTKHNAKGENIHLFIIAFTCLHRKKELHQEKQAYKTQLTNTFKSDDANYLEEQKKHEHNILRHSQINVHWMSIQ